MFTSTVYFIETPANIQRHLLCRLVEVFHEAGRKVQVVTDSSLAAQNLDQFLWTFSQESFIPHRLLAAKTMDSWVEPVVITVGETPLAGVDFLVCDSSVSLEFMKHYPVSIHFVLQDDVDRKQESRLLWQACGDQGVGRHHVPYNVQREWSDIFTFK